jgi:hypothetical protein
MPAPRMSATWLSYSTNQLLLACVEKPEIKKPRPRGPPLRGFDLRPR